MKYISTRMNIEAVDSAAAVNHGMVPGGGLFVPEAIPEVSREFLTNLKDMSYEDISIEILKLYFTDYSPKELKGYVRSAYSSDKFSSSLKTPVVKLEDDLYIAELWHGPTGAFKDMALQIMPRIFSGAKKKLNIREDSLILVATSGDTGKAALEGFKDIEGIKMAVFYPSDGVSQIQRLQMETTIGSNVIVSSVDGNFDDCQTEVKNLFKDSDFIKSLEGINISSANSINLARLIPQIIYYFASYAQLADDLAPDEKVDFSVPTGNFGNILAGYYAKKMGLPIDRLICSSNTNNILHDFISTGVYDTNRQFHKTMSPSMDILVSSNLERFLYHLSCDKKEVSELYSSLDINKVFNIEGSLLDSLKENIFSSWIDEKKCLNIIKDVYDKYGYPIDPHTAIALGGAADYKKNKTIVMSTASIYKFPSTIVKGIYGEEMDELSSLEVLKNDLIINIPDCIEAIKGLNPTDINKISSSEMKNFIRTFIKS